MRVRAWKATGARISSNGEGRSPLRGTKGRLLGAVLLATFVASASHAAPIRFEFEGTVSVASGIWSGQGTTVTGFYEYDTNAVDIMIDDSGHDAFATDVMPNDSMSFVMSVTVGSTTRTTETNRRRDGERHHLVQVFDRPSDDAFEFTAFRRSPNDDFGQLSFRDPSLRGSATDPDGIAEGSFNLVDAPMTSALDVALFQISRGTYQAWHDDAVCIEGYVDFEITNLEVVPEPGTGLLVGIGLIALAARRRPAT